MTIHVQTYDFGVQSFSKADDWETEEDGCDEGHLWVGVRETGEGVAEFAKGSWVFVYEEDEGEPVEDPAEPRVWESIFDIPHGTLVEPAHDPCRYYITTHGTGWYINPEDKPHTDEDGWVLRETDNNAGPFTEVVG